MSVSFISLTCVACLAIACGSSSCGLKADPLPRQRPRPVLYEWNDEGGEAAVSIRISLTDQVAEFKRGSREIGWCYVATGKEGHRTTPGHYQIIEKIRDKHSNRYGWYQDELGNITDNDAESGDRVPEGMVYVPAPMPHWMRLTRYGVGMHGGLIPEPGKTASHGCIRLPKEFVPLLYQVVVLGTPVIITRAPATGNFFNRFRLGAPEAPSRPRSPVWSRIRGLRANGNVEFGALGQDRGGG